MFFIGKIKYDTINNAGKDVVSVEEIIVQDHTFTGAESTAYKEYEERLSGDFDVSAMRKTKIEEIHTKDGGEYWFEADIAFLDVNEKTGKEKEHKSKIMVCDDSLQEAIDRINKESKEILVPWEIKAIKKTKIVEVFFLPDDTVEIV